MNFKFFLFIDLKFKILFTEKKLNYLNNPISTGDFSSFHMWE